MRIDKKENDNWASVLELVVHVRYVGLVQVCYVRLCALLTVSIRRTGRRLVARSKTTGRDVNGRRRQGRGDGALDRQANHRTFASSLCRPHDLVPSSRVAIFAI